MRKKRWQHRALLVMGLLVAFALRLYRLGAQNIWWDEGLSILAARKSFAAATLWTAADVHPPLYFWLLWLWRRLAGESWFALRFITVLEGMLAVALLVPLGRRVSGRATVGTLALWLLALSRFHIWWSQEMRMYILAGTMALLALTFLLGWLRHPDERREWVGVVLATTAALYTIYANVQLLLIENLTVLWAGLHRPRAERWRMWRAWVGGQLATFLLFLPWLMLALPRMRSWSVVREPATLRFVAELYAVLLTTGISTFVGRYAPLALPPFVLIAWAVVELWRKEPGRRVGLLMTLCGFLLPPLVIWVLTQPRSLFYTPRVEARYLLPFAPLFYLLLAWALERWRHLHRWAAWGAIGALFALMISFLPGYYTGRYLRDDYLTMSRLIWAYGRPDDLVILVSGDRYAIFLPDYDAPQAPEDRPPVFLMPGDGPLDAATVESILRPLLAAHPRLWLAEIEAAMQDPQGRTRAWLRKRLATPLDFHFGYNQLTLFAASADEPGVTHPPRLARPRDLGTAISLVGWELATHEFRPSDRVRFLLYLRSDRPSELQASLVGEDGRSVATQPITLTARLGVVVRLTDFLITPYTPPQRYHLRLEGGEGAVLEMGQVIVRPGRTTRPPVRVESIDHPLDVHVGDSIRLLGYDLRGARGGRLRPGTTLRLRLYWQTDAPITEDLRVFTHLVGTAYNPRTQGPLWAQDDQVPLEGVYPTYEWLVGIPLADDYELVLPPEMPVGEYWLTVGLYGPDGERLPVSSHEAPVEERAVLLTVLQVEP